jgi:DNA-binding response OmpR family regulator
MSESKHIVVVDDCELIRDALTTYLTRVGFRTSAVVDGESMRASLTKGPADLVILDLNMPGEDGFSLTRYLRQTSACGIIMLTGRADPTDRVVALELGADDIVAKPYDARELLARVRSVLRRAPVPGSTAPGDDLEVVYDFGTWGFDPSRRRVTSGDDAAELTTAEFNLLNAFVKKPGRVQTREHLLEIVYDRPWDYYDRSIDVLVTRLRRKLEAVAKDFNAIKSVRGAGYMFSATPAQLRA